jgi:hypothetical protein
LRDDKEIRSEEVPAQADRPLEDNYFDELAMELADGTLMRSRLLKYIGAAIVGSSSLVEGCSAARLWPKLGAVVAPVPAPLLNVLLSAGLAVVKVIPASQALLIMPAALAGLFA